MPSGPRPSMWVDSTLPTGSTSDTFLVKEASSTYPYPCRSPEDSTRFSAENPVATVINLFPFTEKDALFSFFDEAVISSTDFSTVTELYKEEGHSFSMSIKI